MIVCLSFSAPTMVNSGDPFIQRGTRVEVVESGDWTTKFKTQDGREFILQNGAIKHYMG
jgi:hypothetical protein